MDIGGAQTIDAKEEAVVLPKSCSSFEDEKGSHRSMIVKVFRAEATSRIISNVS